MKEPCAGEVHQSVGGLMMAGLMLALFIAALDSTVVATALPTISAALGGAEHYAWPMTAYLASSTVSTLLCGGFAFHFGLKRTYAFGLALFAAASALCAVAPTIEALAAFRLLQGIGGGLLEAGVFIAAAMMLPPRDRGPYLGVASAMYGVASVIGPVIGGAVAQGLSWHVIFVVNIPIAIVAFALSSSSLPGRGERSRATQFDAAGSVLASLSVLSLVAVFSLAGDAFPLASPQAVALMAPFVILAFALYKAEAAASAPVIPMGLFGRPRVVAGFISGFCVQFALMAGVTYLPRLLQESMGVAAGRGAHSHDACPHAWEQRIGRPVQEERQTSGDRADIFVFGLSRCHSIHCSGARLDRALCYTACYGAWSGRWRGNAGFQSIGADGGRCPRRWQGNIHGDVL